MSEKRTRKKSRRATELETVVVEEPIRRRQKRASIEPTPPKSSGKKAKSQELTVSLNFVKLDLRVKDAPSLRSRNSTPEGSNAGSSESPRKNVQIRFKDPKFSFSYLASNKKKTWKNLKQILTAERGLEWDPQDPTYSNIDAPPPFKPPKKYADISGLIAKYTDPLSGMYFSTSEEFQLIRTLPQDIVQGYLALRGKIPIT